MTIDKVFFAYMALVGIATGTSLVAMPAVQDFFVKPYFWILLAVVLYDVGTYLLGAKAQDRRLLMPVRLLGFVIGVVLMMAIPSLTGTSVRYF